jgi:hypothetical protein
MILFILIPLLLDKDKKGCLRNFRNVAKRWIERVCYQADNRWYIEGINVRNLRKVTYQKNTMH